VSSRDRLMPWSGTGSWVTGRAGHGQLTDGSRVTKCDPLSAMIIDSATLRARSVVPLSAYKFKYKLRGMGFLLIRVWQLLMS